MNSLCVWSYAANKIYVWPSFLLETGYSDNRRSE